MLNTRNPNLRVLIISGSQRRQKNCPESDSKSRALMQRMASRLPQDWIVDTEDLGNLKHTAHIQPCNACVSTSMALCVWPCNCYTKNDLRKPDLLWNIDMYARLDLADAWAIIGPINWYAPTSNLKLMFDRLVCMSGGNPRDDLIDNKNAEKAKQLEHSEQWKELNQNHLEGRTAGFFCHGDEGGRDLDENGYVKILRHKEYMDPKHDEHAEFRNAYAPLVWQCRYSGIEVPDALWRYETSGKGKHYADNQVADIDDTFYAAFDSWTDSFAAFVGGKGKAMPGQYPAYNYDQSDHME